MYKMTPRARQSLRPAMARHLAVRIASLVRGDVPDDSDGTFLGVVVLGFSLYGGDGAEKLIGDVSENGGAARGDAVLCEEEQEAGEEIVDGSGGCEFAETCCEGGGEIGGRAAILVELGVAVTEGSDFLTGEAPLTGDFASMNREAAAGTFGKAVLTAW